MMLAVRRALVGTKPAAAIHITRKGKRDMDNSLRIRLVSLSRGEGSERPPTMVAKFSVRWGAQVQSDVIIRFPEERPGENEKKAYDMLSQFIRRTDAETHEGLSKAQKSWGHLEWKSDSADDIDL